MASFFVLYTLLFQHAYTVQKGDMDAEKEAVQVWSGELA
jgi:hypothetical protein